VEPYFNNFKRKTCIKDRNEEDEKSLSGRPNFFDKSFNQLSQYKADNIDYRDIQGYTITNLLS
jgi:hypothetical protein